MEEPVQIIRLRDPDAPALESSEGARPGLPNWIAWSLPMVFLAATLFGVWIVMSGPVDLFGWMIGLAIVVLLGWVLMSSMLPAAPANRRCPECGLEDGLGPAHRDTTQGVACSGCDYLDETASAWMIAEEDGPLDQVVLRERAVRRGETPLSPEEPAR